MDREHLKIADHRHVDHENPHTFEIDDLKKLIEKTSQDLAEADKKRRVDFKVLLVIIQVNLFFLLTKHLYKTNKEYEMQKEFEKQEKLRTLDEEHRKQYEEDLKHQQQKHNSHERVHHPGNKAQLEEGE